VEVRAAVPAEARTEQWAQMKKQRDLLLRQRQMEEERAARQRVFDDLARQFARERERAARKRQMDEERAARKRRADEVPIGACKRARTRQYHGADDEDWTVCPPWRRSTRRPICFEHDPWNGYYCVDQWCNKEHVDTCDMNMRRRYAAAMRAYRRR